MGYKGDRGHSPSPEAPRKPGNKGKAMGKVCSSGRFSYPSSFLGLSAATQHTAFSIPEPQPNQPQGVWWAGHKGPCPYVHSLGRARREVLGGASGVLCLPFMPITQYTVTHTTSPVGQGVSYLRAKTPSIRGVRTVAPK